MSSQKIHLELVRQKLDKRDAEKNYLRVLDVFIPVGVADTTHIERHTGFNRPHINRLLDKMRHAAAGGPAVITQIREPVSRPGIAGRGRNIYALGPAGAALQREAGYPNARPCGLKQPTNIAHALDILEVRLAAEAAGLTVETEREIRFGGRAIRPDNVITPKDGVKGIFESEREARPPSKDRILESVRNKVAFFKSPEGKKVSPIVRVIFGVSPGRNYTWTIDVWEHIVAAVAQEEGGELPFQLWAISLGDFLSHPDFSEPPETPGWENLLDPVRLETFGAPAKELAGADSPANQAKPDESTVKALLRRAPRENHLILTAIWQIFQEEVAAGKRAEFSRPDPGFFRLMEFIYSVSHNPDAPPVIQSAVPHESLFMLRQYIAMCPELHGALSKAIGRGSGSMRWNSTAVLHRIQVVINRFLKYHGWVVGHYLKAYPSTAPWDYPGPRNIGVTVEIHPELLMGSEDSIVPNRDEIEYAETALAWVLWALFEYASELDLRAPVFW